MVNQCRTLFVGVNPTFVIGGKKRKAYACNVCGKEGQPANIMNHIEANHIDSNTLAISVKRSPGQDPDCKIINLENIVNRHFCRSRHSLTNHKYKDHKAWFFVPGPSRLCAFTRVTSTPINFSQCKIMFIYIWSVVVSDTKKRQSGLKNRFGKIAKKESVAEGVNSCDCWFCLVGKTANKDDRSFLQHSRVKQYAYYLHF